MKVKAKVWDSGLMPGIDPHKIYDVDLLPCGERFKILLDGNEFTMSINNTGYLTGTGSGSWEIIST